MGKERKKKDTKGGCTVAWTPWHCPSPRQEALQPLQRAEIMHELLGLTNSEQANSEPASVGFCSMQAPAPAPLVFLEMPAFYNVY